MSKGHVCWLLGALALLTLGAPATAEKEPGGEDAQAFSQGVSAETRAAAQELFEAGNESFSDGRHAEALTSYEQALELWPHPRLHLNAAASCVEIERYLEADRHIEAAQAHRSFLAREERKKLDTLAAVVAANTAMVRIVTDQAGAVISLDGKPVLVGPGEARQRVSEGDHQVLAKRPGLEPTSRVLTLALREERTVEPTLFVSANEWRWAKWKPWALAGVGAAIALGGAPLAVSARSLRDQQRAFVNAECSIEGGCSPENQARADALTKSAERREFTAIAAFSIGAAVGMTGLTLAILNRPRTVRRRAEDGEVSASLWLDSETVGASLAGRF